MATGLYKGADRLYLKLSELVVAPRRTLSSSIKKHLRDNSEDAKKVIAIYFANRLFNNYRGFIKYGKMNFRIHTKDNGIVIVIKHEW